MAKIIFIIPYFGKLNNYFQLFLNSCGYNSDVFDFLIITDDHTGFIYPQNVRVIYYSFEELVKEVQQKFDFEISLSRPYKLCDYKPAYGYIFEEYIKDYEFWGHCDTDLIWGRARNFLTDDIFENYDKLFFLGHCTAYKNDYENNRIFMRSNRYMEVYRNRQNVSFDEEFKNSINNEFANSNKKILYEEFEANIYVKANNFKITRYDFETNAYANEKKNKLFFIWNEGVLNGIWSEGNKYRKKEYLYIHLQARKMKNKVNNLQQFKIVPNAFEDLESLDDLAMVKKGHFNINYLRVRTHNAILKLRKTMGL